MEVLIIRWLCFAKLSFVKAARMFGHTLTQFGKDLRAKAGWFSLLIFSAALGSVPAKTQDKSPAPSSSFTTISAKANEARDANQLEQAIALYKKALVLHPRWTEGWWSLGTIEYDQDDYAKAAQAFEKVRALDPKAGTARVMLGLCEFELGQDESALKYIEEGKKIGIADDPQLRHVMLYHEGVLLQRRAKFESAQEVLNQECVDAVQNDNVTQELGMTALRMPGKPALVEGSTGADVVSGVGHAECLAAQRKFDEARQDYGELVHRYPEYPSIHYAYGRFLLEANDTAAAIEEFEREIQNDPGHVFARLEIAAVKYRVDSEAGLPYAEEAVKRNPQLPLGHYILGLLLLDTHNYKRAVPELEMARAAFPNEGKVYFALATAYAHTGRQPEAARAKATFLRLSQQAAGSSASTVYGQEPLGAAHERLGKETDAKTPPQ